ncbi:MAG: hypothetical protein OSJ72_19470 [Lachnospiraceae bacterium]|nr:hypothetical protein [Lachnospiraceae bacterium]
MVFELMGNSFTLLALIGMLAALTMIVTEMIKDLWLVARVPTKLTALAVSLMVIAGAMTVYLNMADMAFQWWYLVAAFFAAFIVGYLSINSWDTLYEIWKRFVPDSKGR